MTVYIHWSWFVVAYFMIMHRPLVNNIALQTLIYLGLFGIVLLHEFGHALACKSVGGKAETIVLWPLGGVAMVSPPPRPGANLWAIVAGPLVNVALLPVLWGLAIATGSMGDMEKMSPNQTLIFVLALINTALLIFNMLPVYPLDGGQTLQSLLWFFVGRTRSLQIAAGIGVVVAAVLLVPALYYQSLWNVVLLLFIGFNAWQGVKMAQKIGKLEKAGYRVDGWDG